MVHRRPSLVPLALVGWWGRFRLGCPSVVGAGVPINGRAPRRSVRCERSDAWKRGFIVGSDTGWCARSGAIRGREKSWTETRRRQRPVVRVVQWAVRQAGDFVAMGDRIGNAVG